MKKMTLRKHVGSVLTALMLVLLYTYGIALADDVNTDSVTETIQYSDNSVYVGETPDGKTREGQGTLTWGSGEIYTGSWVNGLMTGDGQMTWPGLGKYEGAFKDGKRNGYGTFTWQYDREMLVGDPVSFDGEWKNDKIGESGKLVLWGVGCYEGSFEDQKKCGEGTFTWENGDTYVGTWQNDSMKEGTLTLSDGTTTTGRFKRQVLNHGTLAYAVPNGTAVRDVSEGKISANVVVTYTDGTIISGKTDQDNVFTGNVKVTYKNGDTYTGTLDDGLKSGKGTYTWENGAHYVGEWKDDKMHGKGKYYYTSSEKKSYISGKFSNGTPKGDVKYVDDNGTAYTATWLNGECIRIKYGK